MNIISCVHEIVEILFGIIEDFIDDDLRRFRMIRKLKICIVRSAQIGDTISRSIAVDVEHCFIHPQK